MKRLAIQRKRTEPGRLTLQLPWPPSVNHYWRHWHGRTLISRQGRQYRDEIKTLALIGRWGSFGKQRLKLFVRAFPPDRRKRDLDNLAKPLLDSLEHAGLYEDDEQIDDYRIVRREPHSDGLLVVELEAVVEAARGVV